MNRFLYHISIGTITAGVDVDDGVITGTAPVLGWMKGKTIAWAVDYWRRHDATVRWMRWPDGEWESEE
jgi:hypothetical protein